LLRTLTAAGLCALAPTAHAALITVDFDGLDGGLRERPADFYDGGSGAKGSGPGPDYGITFVPFGATSTEPGSICNVPLQCDGGAGNSLFIFGDKQNGTEHGTIMQIEGGFRGIVEFDASISNAGVPAVVQAGTDFTDNSAIWVFEIRHPDPSDPCGRLECEFVHYSFNLADDPHTPDDVVAYTILFRTKGTDALFIDNIRFHDLILPGGDTPPASVPEPSTALLFGGAGLLGAMLRRRHTLLQK
jgi:hypothetical protein